MINVIICLMNIQHVDCWDYFMIPLGEVLQTSLKTHAANLTSGLPSLREGIGGINLKNKCRGFAPLHFSLLSLCKINFPRSSNEKCPIKGHLFFKRRLRDSNPRNSFPFTRFPSVLLQPLGQISFGGLQK